jgi:hypothetical protein
MISQEEIQGWKNHPVTKEYFKMMKQLREELLEQWANSNFTAETSEGTAQLNAKALGKVQLLDELLDFYIEE